MNFKEKVSRRLRGESLEKRVLLAAEIGQPSFDFLSDPSEMWADSGPVQTALQATSPLATSPPATIQRATESPLKATEYRLLRTHADPVQGDLLRSTLQRDQFSDQQQVELSIPRPDGGFDQFLVSPSSILPPELSAKFPSINTFSGVSVNGSGDRLFADLSPRGFHAMVLSTEGNYYVDPYYYFDDRLYASYFTAGEFLSEAVERLGIDDVSRQLKEDVVAVDNQASVSAESTSPTADLIGNTAPRSGTELRTYRTAVAVTGEYTAFHGGTVQDGLSAVVTAMNRVSGVYESELSIRLELIPNNDQLIYTDANTDPYTNNDGFALLGENQSNVDSVIGNGNYDLGHVFNTGGGGLAGLGVIGIDGAKARGQTGLPSPINDAFYIDYVAHEIGHQFGGDHTFNGDSGSCAGNANSATAYEPGSGSTIQAYAGICGNDNLQNNSDAYFHSISFDQMIAHVDGVIPTVGTRTQTGNQVPVVDGGQDYTIPAGTAFALTATGTDGNGDTLTYNWEQRDLGPQADVNAPDSGQGPLFRSWTPTTDPTRVFPRIDDLLAGTTTVGEQLPTTNRSLNFRVIARDNRLGGGGVATDDVRLTVVDTGAPFRVNELPSGSSWQAFSRQTVTWDVAGTDGGNIRADRVDILLSSDGGQNFDTTLAASVPNDGSHEVVVPDVQTSQARIKVQASQNVFFDLSDADFTIDQPGTTRDFGDSPAPYPTLIADDGPFHVVGGPILGFTVDAEPDGQPSTLADGDGIDDDGLSIRAPLVAGQTGVFTVSTATGGQFEMFLDFNGNGVFDRTFLETVQRTLTPGVHDISVSVPSTAPESTVVRMRISTTGGLGPTGVAFDGEVEDHIVRIYRTPPPMDFGDAPDSYGTLEQDNGPRHVLQQDSFLGSQLDSEPDGNPSSQATQEGRDDDGITFRELLIPGQPSVVQVEASIDGFLDYFIDFDGDGVFGNNSNETFTASVVSGSQLVSFNVPGSATFGSTMSRFRFSTTGGLSPTGLAFDGEVEDYQVVIIEDTRDRLLQNFDFAAVPSLPAGWSTSPNGQAIGWVTEASTGEFGSTSVYLASPASNEEVILESPKFQVEVPEARVRFRNQFNTENQFDGGVLEISIDDSPYQDIITAGGLFLSGGYTGTIDTGFGNPLAGRDAWTGDSLGWINSEIRLPAGTAGSDVSLRWRYGADESVAFGGWRLDSVRYDGPELQFDFGDAPNGDQVPPGESAVESASHVLGTLILGASIDTEAASQPTPEADGDDAQGLDDEDGVEFPSSWTTGENTLVVQASEAGVLNLWLDLDADGFGSSGDHFVKDLAIAQGVNDVVVNLPDVSAGILPAGAMARVRISHQAGLSFNGSAGDGEVEDYLVGPESSVPVNVESIQLNDGSEQRSQVTSVTVTFDGQTELSPNAFSIVNRSYNSLVNIASTVATLDGKTVATLTFDEGPNVSTRESMNSLVDGNFELRVEASRVAGLQNDYRFGDQASDAFFRLLGDGDGDRDVDGQDYGRFGLTFLRSSEAAEFNAIYDANGDGDVDGQDYGQFGLRFLQSLRF